MVARNRIKYVLITLVLPLAVQTMTAATVAKYPVQNQTPQTTSHNQNSETKKNNSQLQPAPTVEAEQNVPLQRPTAEKRNNSIKNGDPDPDWWAIVPNILIAFGTLVLAGVGAIGTCAAIKTLKAIRRQGRIMIQQTRVLQRQARAAEETIQATKENAEILANIERPWVDIRLIRQTTSIYFVEITNYGRTVAHINVIYITRILKDNEGSLFQPKMETHPKSKILVPQVSWSPININPMEDLGESMFNKVRRGEIKLSYRCIVGYAPNWESGCLYFYDAAPNYGCLRSDESPENNPHT